MYLYVYIIWFRLVGDCVNWLGGVGEVEDSEIGLRGWEGWESVDIIVGKVFLVYWLNLLFFFEIVLIVFFYCVDFVN